MPTSIELAWAAGFLEGEAWFGCAGKRSIVVKAAQVNREPLDRLKSILGGNITGPIDRGNPNHTPFFNWALCGSPAAAVMMTVYTFLSEKRRAQVRPAIALWKVAAGPYALRWKCKNGHPYSTENTRLVPRAGRPNSTRGCKTCMAAGQKRHAEKEAMRRGLRG